jgi:diguanylate cyclase
MLSFNCFKLEPAEDAEIWHTKAIEFLAHYNIPAIPVCYHVAYQYVSHGHDEFTDSIDNQINKSGQLDGHFLLHLFESHCLDGSNNDKLEGHLAELHNLLYKVLEGVTSNCSQTDIFNETLLQQSHALNEDPGVDDLRSIAHTLLQATTQAMNNNLLLRHQLDSIRQQSQSLQNEVDRLRDEISTDSLTGLFNRRALNKRIHELIDTHMVDTEPFSILMVDIDHFKQFNDSFGHLVGDEVIRRVGLAMKSKLREADFPARFGGEEFTVLLPETDISHALGIAQSIHQSVANLILVKRSTKEKLPSITVSVGAASYRKGESPESLIERADQALYLAKESGRNQIVSEAEITYM